MVAIDNYILLVVDIDDIFIDIVFDIYNAIDSGSDDCIVYKIVMMVSIVTVASIRTILTTTAFWTCTIHTVKRGSVVEFRLGSNHT